MLKTSLFVREEKDLLKSLKNFEKFPGLSGIIYNNSNEQIGKGMISYNTNKSQKTRTFSVDT